MSACDCPKSMGWQFHRHPCGERGRIECLLRDEPRHVCAAAPTDPETETDRSEASDD